MVDKFFSKTTQNEQALYKELLEITGALSRLFTESENPFLYYRAMENIFCKAFNAKNLSRSDISADAIKDRLGIGLKTFLQSNGNTFQKVAEFNKESHLLRDLSGKNLIEQVCIMRNERIKSTMRICNLNDMIYHLITRSKNYMAIYEEHMDSVDIERITITNKLKNSIHFCDGKHDYSFSLSKNTLFKRFDTTEHQKIYGFNVNILEDPFDFLLKAKNESKENFIEFNSQQSNEVDYIVLPLYSTRTGKVEEKSGLNQWNANGRKRDDNEVYINIPAWIHRVKSNFFEYNTPDNKTAPFDVNLPNGEKLSMRVAQQGGKALMSNPNSALGKWILRDILRLKPNELVNRNQLNLMGIDSIKLTKFDDNTFTLDFLSTGSYEKFEKKTRNK